MAVKRKKVDTFFKEEQQLLTVKSYWNNQWQLVSEYIHQRRADFTSSREPGAFINSHIWADEPIQIAETSASAFLGYIWPNGAKSFDLVGNDDVFGKDKEMEEFWNFATKKLQQEMDDNESGLSVAMDESTMDLISLGTDAIFVEERNRDEPRQGCLQFEAWSLTSYALAENAVGRAAKFHRRKERTVEQHVEKYKLENVSKRVRDLYTKGQLMEKVVTLHVIEERPRDQRNLNSIAAKDMPWRSIHIEVETKKILLDSGYQELPVACSRLAKRVKEVYGRGRGMNAIPSIMMLNQVMEDFSLALEKKLDPPMYQLNDAVSGNGYIDTSAGGINILRVDKATANIPPTGKLFDIQDTRETEYIIQRLTEIISNHFMLDRLLDLNNDVQMTRGEAFLRNAIRQSTLRSIVGRIILEKFNPLINTSFMICLRRNKFGYMPGDPEAAALERAGKKVRYLPQKVVDAIQDGEDLYTIQYETPAARDMMAEEGQGMLDTLAVAGEMTGFDDTVRFMIDAEWTLTRLADIKGADRRMFNPPEKVKALIEQAQQAQQRTSEMAMAQQAAGVAKDVAIAQNTNSQ